jgi:hypothetical protein
MPDYVTDTHGLVWYLEDSPRLGQAARECFEACDRGDSIISSVSKRTLKDAFPQDGCSSHFPRRLFP